MKTYTSDMFVKDKATKDGLNVYCKKCTSRYQRKRYRVNKEKGILPINPYIKGVGKTDVATVKLARLLEIKQMFRDWCKNGGEFK